MENEDVKKFSMAFMEKCKRLTFWNVLKKYWHLEANEYRQVIKDEVKFV